MLAIGRLIGNNKSNNMCYSKKIKKTAIAKKNNAKSNLN